MMVLRGVHGKLLSSNGNITLNLLKSVASYTLILQESSTNQYQVNSCGRLALMPKYTIEVEVNIQERN